MATMLIPDTANCGTLGDWAKRQGRFYSYTTEPKYGDLVLFDFSGNHKTRQHVGIYIGGGNFIHAANPRKGVVITSLSNSYYAKRYVTARRIIN